MPFYFRKRPGSKNVKANVTQRGLRSLTFTSGSKKGQPRLNFNTSRGWSFSFPGTGVMWRQKGYGNSKYESVVEERGYDLRTKEGRSQHAENKANEAISVTCFAVGAAIAWLTDSPHGFWAGYILFWLLAPIKNESLSTLVWAFFVHLFAAAGYGISLLFDASSYEPAIWGAVIGNFVSAHFNRTVGFNIFLLCLFLGCWAFFGEPSIYFADLAERLVGAKYIGLPPMDLSIDLSNLNRFLDDTLNPLFATDGPINPLFFTLNIYASIALFFGFYRWGKILWKKPLDWASSKLDLFLLRLVGIAVFFCSHVCCIILSILFFALFYDQLPRVSQMAFYNYPVMAFFLASFSPTVGVIINISLRREKDQERNFWPIIFQCAVTLFWLPALFYKRAQEQAPKNLKSTTVNEAPSLDKTLKKSEPMKRQKADPSENQEASDVSDKFFILSRKKLQHQGLDSAIDGILGLGKKRQSALVQAYPDLSEILEKSDGEISLQTGLGSKLIKRVKFALGEATKAKEKDILSEYLSYVFPLKSQPRNLTLAAFSSFEQLYQFCKDPDDALSTLNKDELAKLFLVTLQQQIEEESDIDGVALSPENERDPRNTSMESLGASQNGLDLGEGQFNQQAEKDVLRRSDKKQSNTEQRFAPRQELTDGLDGWARYRNLDPEQKNAIKLLISNLIDNNPALKPKYAKTVISIRNTSHPKQKVIFYIISVGKDKNIKGAFAATKELDFVKSVVDKLTFFSPKIVERIDGFGLEVTIPTQNTKTDHLKEIYSAISSYEKLWT